MLKQIVEEKIISSKEFLTMFPEINMTSVEKERFLKITETTKIIRLKNSKTFIPLYQDNIGSYYLVGKKTIYLTA